MRYQTTTLKTGTVDHHYLEKSFEFYPCTCKFNRRLLSKISMRCQQCLLSTQSRIIQMKSKI